MSSTRTVPSESTTVIVEIDARGVPAALSPTGLSASGFCIGFQEIGGAAGEDISEARLSLRVLSCLI
jgi:hypothetical protein